MTDRKVLFFFGVGLLEPLENCFVVSGIFRTSKSLAHACILVAQYIAPSGRECVDSGCASKNDMSKFRSLCDNKNEQLEPDGKTLWPSRFA